MLLSGAAQDDSQPGDDLFQAERLGDVVVAAEGQPGDLVLQRITGGKEQRGRVDAVGAQSAQHPETVHTGHHHVEDHRVRLDFAGQIERRCAISRGVDLEALKFEADRQQFDDGVLVVDDENPCLWCCFLHCC